MIIYDEDCVWIWWSFACSKLRVVGKYSTRRRSYACIDWKSATFSCTETQPPAHRRNHLRRQATDGSHLHRCATFHIHLNGPAVIRTTLCRPLLFFLRFEGIFEALVQALHGSESDCVDLCLACEKAVLVRQDLEEVWDTFGVVIFHFRGFAFFWRGCTN